MTARLPVRHALVLRINKKFVFLLGMIWRVGLYRHRLRGLLEGSMGRSAFVRSGGGRHRRHRAHSIGPSSMVALISIGAVLASPLGTASSRARDLGGLQLLGEEAAMAQARATDDPVVASALTTETTIVTALPDGNYQAEISPVPVRVQDLQSGSWADIDNTLVRGEDGSIRPRVPGAPMSFSGGGDEPLVTMEDGDRSMAMSWPDALPEPTLVGSSVQYESVLPGVDLVATAGALGFTTYVVVHSAEAAKHPMIRKLVFDVDADGVQVSESAGSGIVAKDGGETVFRASQPLMWDAEGSPAEKSAAPDAVSPGDLKVEDEAAGAPLTPSSDAAPVPMAVDASNSEISVTPQASVLSDPDTKWPVVIDPGFSATRGYGGELITHWTMVWSNGLEFYDHPSEDARVGYDGWHSAGSSDIKKSEAFYRIDVSALNGAKVHSAIFRHQLLHSPNNDCNASSWGPAVQVGLTGEFTGSTTWSNRPGWWDSDRVASNSTVTGQEGDCPAKHLEWNLTGSVGIHGRFKIIM